MPNQLLNIKVIIAGETLKGVANISIHQWLEKHHDFVVSLPFDAVEDEKDLTISKPQKWVGKEITLEIKNSENENLKFIGIVTRIGFLKDSSGERHLEIGGFSPTILLEQGSRYAAFYQKDIGQIAKKTLNESSKVKNQISPKNNPQEEYYVKYNESNYAFLGRLAAQSGNWFFYDGTKVIFGDAPAGTAKKLGYRAELFHFELHVHYPNGEFQMKDWNYLKSQVYESDSKSVSVKGIGKFGKDASDTASVEQAINTHIFPAKMAWQGQSILKEQVSHQKKNDYADTVMMSGGSSELSLKIGDIVQIEERFYGTANNKKSEDMGSYRIVQLHHHIGQDGHYQNSFVSIPADIEFYAPQKYAQPRADTQIAKVMDNKDPEKLGRVRVLFLWQTFQNDNEPSMWIPVMMSQVNGKTPRGNYFVPEKEDMVTVMFENADPTRPLIMGGIHHKDVQPNDFYHDQNYYKVIATRSGNQIFISDEPGKEEIRIYNKDKKNKIILSLDDPHITIESTGTIELKGKIIKMKAEKIEMDASEELKIEAGKTALNNKQGLKVSAGSEIDLSANGTMNIESKSQTKVKGGGTLDLESSGKATLKGAMVMIN